MLHMFTLDSLSFQLCCLVKMTDAVKIRLKKSFFRPVKVDKSFMLSRQVIISGIACYAIQ